jgi:flagellar hook-basal body complex protein FliE
MSNSISPLRFPDIATPTAASATKSKSAFEAVLQDAMHKVEQFNRTAAEGVEKLLSGESEDLHRTILAGQRAELAFELFQQVRNKVVQAYQEVMRMPM